MTSSSDSDLELGQRSQPQLRSDPATEAEETSPHKPKTPWDLMRAKSNKAFSRNYLQDVIGGSPKLETLPSDSRAKPGAPLKLFGEHGPGPVPDEDEESESEDEVEIDEVAPAQELPSGSQTIPQTPSKNKKVIFNDTVLKRDIEISTTEESDTTDDEEVDEHISKEIHKDSSVKLTGAGQKKDSKNPEESGTKKSSTPNYNHPPIKQKSKFTITTQAEVSKKSFSSTLNSSLEKIHSKNGVIGNRTSNVQSSSSNSENEELSEKVDATANLKNPSIKKKSKLQLKVLSRSNKSSSESSDTEEEKHPTKSKAINKTNSISNIMLPSKKAVSKTVESSSNKDSKVQEKKHHSNKKTNKAKETLLDSDSDTENNVNKSRLSDTESSGKEFDNSKSTITKNSSFTKKTNLKYDTTGSDVDTFSPSKRKNEFLYKKLETYSTLNNFEKVTSATYNLSKDLRSGNNEIYIAQIPKDIHPKSLVDRLIFFDKPTVLNVENKTYTLNVNFDKDVSRIVIADNSGSDGNHFNVSSIKPTGILSVSKENKVKRKSIKIHKEPAEEVVEEPRNLKEQHLLLGRDYEDRVKLDKWISDKLDGLITSFNKKRKHKKLKKKSLEKRAKSPEENLDIFKLLDEHTEKKPALDEIDSSYVKKRKKPKSDKCDEGTATEKSEMEESIDIINQLMLENEVSQEEKKSKKKRERSKSVFEEDPQAVGEEKRKRSKSVSMELTERNSLSPLSSSKKKKKSRAVLADTEDLLRPVVSSKKHKKKGIVNSTMMSPAFEGTLLFDQEESGIPKLDDNLSIDSFIDDLVKGVSTGKKKRKRRESNGEETKLYEKKKRKPD